MMAYPTISILLALPIALKVQNLGSMGTATHFLGNELHARQIGELSKSQIRFAIAKIPAELLLKKSREVVNFSGNFLAFILTVSNTEDRIAIEDLKTKTVYIVQGLPSSPRPFSNLKWVWNIELKDWVLSFERWSTPHYGYLYEIDVNQQKLIREVPISG